MIGRGSTFTAGLAVVALGIALGGGAPRPEIAAGAERLVIDRSAVADARLAALRERLAAALEPARSGAARVIAGDQMPSGPLAEAAALVQDAASAASEARDAVVQLQSALRARDPATGALPAAPEPGELASIAGQLSATAAAGDAFVETRRRAQAVAGELETALAALDAGDLDAAASAVREARADHDVVADWEVGAVTLPVWIGTTDAMIGAVERIVEATRRGDADAAQAAAHDFAVLGDDGVTADRALRIAIGEAGSAVSATPLARLAGLLAEIDQLRFAIGEAP